MIPINQQMTQWSNWTTIASGIGVRKNMFGDVEINVNTTFNLAASWNSLATLPDGYQPQNNTFVVANINNNTWGTVNISTDKSLQICSTTALSSAGIRFFARYSTK